MTLYSQDIAVHVKKTLYARCYSTCEKLCMQDVTVRIKNIVHKICSTREKPCMQYVTVRRFTCQRI